MDAAPLWLWTLDFRTASVAERQRFAVPAPAASETLRQSCGDLGATEALVVSTCNRVLWLTVGGAPRPEPDGRVLHGAEAVEHLCRVATGLESLAIGEPQILGQVRDAWEAARRAGTSGPHLDYLMPRILGLAKTVRRECGLGQGATSVAHIGVQQALGVWNDAAWSAAPTALLIGAGKMAAIAVRQLRAQRVRAIHVANRTYETAEQLGESYGACPVAYDEIYRLVRETADVVVCACAAPHAILQPGHFTPGRRIVVVDLALPRNVDPAVASIPGVTLLDLDSLAARVAAGHRKREALAQTAAEALAPRFARLIERYQQRHTHATIESARARWELIRQTELARIRAVFNRADDREWEAIESLAWRLTRKLTHDAVFARTR